MAEAADIVTVDHFVQGHCSCAALVALLQKEIHLLEAELKRLKIQQAAR